MSKLGAGWNKPSSNIKHLLYNRDVWTKCYEMNYSDLHNRVQQGDVMNRLCYMQTYILIFIEVLKVLLT